jgi:YggT family protein
MMSLDLIRGLVFGVFLICAFVAFGSWAVMTRRINPFSKLGQTIRRFADPVLLPVEHWLRKRGGNPRNAGWWILGGSVVGGIVVITLSEWIVIEAARISIAGRAGPRGVLRLVIEFAGRILMFALFARVIGSWFGVGRFNRWMRPAYVLTDWLVEPLRKIVPPVGRIDITPLVAWFLIMILMNLVLGFL